MKNPLGNLNWYSTNLSLKILAMGLLGMIVLALFFPRTQSFMMGAALSWSGLLTYQVFKLQPQPEVEPIDRDPMIELHLQ